MSIPRERSEWQRLKPGWYVLIFFVLYSFGVTVMLARSNEALRRATQLPTSTEATGERSPERAVSTSPQGLWFPIPGVGIPDNAAHLPGSERAYRDGVSQGFDFYASNADIPLSYGTPVIASADGELIRVDEAYASPSPEEWGVLLDQVRGGAGEEELDILRGRQIWIRLDDGTVLRYAHLSDVREGLRPSQRVYRGQHIGYVGNTGTDDGIRGSTAGTRLHFEVWRPDGQFFGEGLSPEQVRLQAASLFVGP